jgi:hypothetical protein
MYNKTHNKMDEICDTGTGYFTTRNMMIASVVLLILYAIYYFMYRSKTNVPPASAHPQHPQHPQENEQEENQ